MPDIHIESILRLPILSIVEYFECLISNVSQDYPHDCPKGIAYLDIAYLILTFLNIAHLMIACM